jgi:dTDP-4-amino-4,6-dideoxygalactose transaminase
VRALEDQWMRLGGYAGVVAMNSATAGLHAALTGLRLEPGCEVIVPPYTMSATIAAVVMADLKPVFADIDPDLFTLTRETVEPRLTANTRAILVVHLFGQMAPMSGLQELARERDLLVLEDAAQAPGASQSGKWPGRGTKGAIFSFNQHKTITCGEGGLLVTDDESVVEVARLVRNHAESVVHAYPHIDPRGLVGWNYRPTELDAAIAKTQTDKLEMLTEWRIGLADRLRGRVAGIPGLTPPLVHDGNRHVYFTFAVRFDEEIWGCSRDALVQALAAEGVPCAAGYVPPLYGLPMFGSEQAAERDPSNFPVCETHARKELFTLPVCRWPATDSDMDEVADAIEKCWEHRVDLSALSAGVA